MVRFKRTEELTGKWHGIHLAYIIAVTPRSKMSWGSNEPLS